MSCQVYIGAATKAVADSNSIEITLFRNCLKIAPAHAARVGSRRGVAAPPRELHSGEHAPRYAPSVYPCAAFARNDERYSDSYMEEYLEAIESRIHSSKNRVKHSMNGALISIGLRSARLRKKALDAARRIGKVDVDHGETGCKTPDAVAAIQKGWQKK